MPKAAFVGCCALLMAGCSEPPPDVEPPLADAQGEPSNRNDWVWASNATGGLGVHILISGESTCELTARWRGQSASYSLVGHLAVVGGSGWPGNYFPTSVTSTSSRSSSIEGLGPSAYVTLAGEDRSLPLLFESIWYRSDSTSFKVEGHVEAFLAFKDLDAGAPALNNSFYEPWAPNARQTAEWRLECDAPVQAAQVRTARNVSIWDDFTFSDQGASIFSGTADGLRLAGLAATKRSHETETNQTLIVSLPVDPEKVSAFIVEGPGVNETWIAPPTTWLLGIGDVDARIETGSGAYDMTWLHMGAGPLIAFHVAIYDWA